MSDSPPLPSLDPESTDTLFSVPYNLVSSQLAAAFAQDAKLESIPVIDQIGLIVAIATLSGDDYFFHLPAELAKEARLGNVYFEFNLNAPFHDSISNKAGRDADTKAIRILAV